MDIQNGLSPLNASESANVIGSANVGDTVQLPEGNPIGAASADVLGEYFSASARRCRQVLPSGGRGEVRLACEREDNSWEWVRSLSNSAIARPLPAVATVTAIEPMVTVDGDDALLIGESLTDEQVVSIEELDSIEPTDNAFTVNPGETLWKFSQRITGNGVNWQAIAEMNNIDDARTIEAGMTLFVPAQLVLQGQ